MWDQNNDDFIGWEKAKIKFGFDECEKCIWKWLEDKICALELW